MEDGKNVDRNFVDIEVDVNSINVHLDNLQDINDDIPFGVHLLVFNYDIRKEDNLVVVHKDCNVEVVDIYYHTDTLYMIKDIYHIIYEVYPYFRNYIKDNDRVGILDNEDNHFVIVYVEIHEVIRVYGDINVHYNDILKRIDIVNDDHYSV